ncbi:Zn(2)-C6 transcription factor, partial [Pseudohyphozyma bogoriensis]
HISLKSPYYARLAHEALETFWKECAVYAPYMIPSEDTYESLSTNSPLLLFAMLAVTSRDHENADFSRYTYNEALKRIQGTLFSDVPPKLDDIRGILIWWGWLSKAVPPAHALGLAIQLDLPESMGRVLSLLLNPGPTFQRDFDVVMPHVRVWLSIYCEDVWASVASGKRSLVSIDNTIESARVILNVPSLRPLDARLLAQCELVTILGKVQERFLRAPPESIEERVRVVLEADGDIAKWLITWKSWAAKQHDQTRLFMEKGWEMQSQVGRFWINSLGLRDVTSAEDISAVQMPVLRASVAATIAIHGSPYLSGARHGTEFRTFSLASSALFLSKMIKFLPDAVPDVQLALAALRNGAQSLESAPPSLKHYHSAVVGALSHLEQHIAAAVVPRESLVGAQVSVPPTESHVDPALLSILDSQE